MSGRPTKEEQAAMREEHLKRLTPSEKREFLALEERLAAMSPEERKAELQAMQQQAIMERLTPEQQIEYLEKKAIMDKMTPAEREAEMARLRDKQIEEAREAMAAMNTGRVVTPQQRAMVDNMQRQAEVNLKAKLKAQYRAMSPEKKAELKKKKEKVEAIIKKLKLPKMAAHTYIALFGQTANQNTEATEEQKKSGLLYKPQADKLLARTDLTKEVLDKIWEMSDREQRGDSLDEADFICMMFLVGRAQADMGLKLQPSEKAPMPKFKMEEWELPGGEGVAPGGAGDETKNEDEDEMPALE